MAESPARLAAYLRGEDEPVETQAAAARRLQEQWFSQDPHDAALARRPAPQHKALPSPEIYGAMRAVQRAAQKNPIVDFTVGGTADAVANRAQGGASRGVFADYVVPTLEAVGGVADVGAVAKYGLRRKGADFVTHHQGHKVWQDGTPTKYGVAEPQYGAERPADEFLHPFDQLAQGRAYRAGPQPEAGRRRFLGQVGSAAGPAAALTTGVGVAALATRALRRGADEAVEGAARAIKTGPLRGEDLAQTVKGDDFYRFDPDPKAHNAFDEIEFIGPGKVPEPAFQRAIDEGRIRGADASYYDGTAHDLRRLQYWGSQKFIDGNPTPHIKPRYSASDNFSPMNQFGFAKNIDELRAADPGYAGAKGPYREFLDHEYGTAYKNLTEAQERAIDDIWVNAEKGFQALTHDSTILLDALNKHRIAEAVRGKTHNLAYALDEFLGETDLVTTSFDNSTLSSLHSAFENVDPRAFDFLKEFLSSTIRRAEKMGNTAEVASSTAMRHRADELAKLYQNWKKGVKPSLAKDAAIGAGVGAAAGPLYAASQLGKKMNRREAFKTVKKAGAISVGGALAGGAANSVRGFIK